MRLLYGQVQTFQTAMTYLSQQVTSLQARLSASGQDDTSLALQTIVSTLAANAAQLISMGNAISSIQLLVGTVMDSTVETPSIAAGALSAITLDWSIAFPDNTYTVSYGMEDSSGYLAITGFVYQDSGWVSRCTFGTTTRALLIKAMCMQKAELPLDWSN